MNNPITTPLGSRALRRLALSIVAGLLMTLGLVALPTTIASAASTVGGPISRDEVLERAQFWVDQRVPYSQSATSPDPQGLRYRADCSGMVSMAWHMGAPGLSTQTLDTAGTQLAGLDSAQPGDMLLKKTPSNGNPAHSVIFISWTDDSHRTARVYQQPVPGRFAEKTTFSRSYLQEQGYVAYAYRNISGSQTTPPATIAPQRIVGIGADGAAFVKEGNLYAGWTSLGFNAKQVVADGDRIGLLANDGKLYVKEGGTDAAWVHILSNIASFDLSGARIGVVGTDGQAFTKEGGLSAGWVKQLGGITDIKLDAERIGLLSADGHLYVKNGDQYAEWTDQISNVKKIELSEGRIGVIGTDDKAFVKEGLLGSWVNVANDVSDVALTGNRVGIVRTNGVSSVKEGNLSQPWVTQLSNVQDIELAGNRVGVRGTDNKTFVKDGNLAAAWVQQLGFIDLSLT